MIKPASGRDATGKVRLTVLGPYTFSLSTERWLQGHPLFWDVALSGTRELIPPAAENEEPRSVEFPLPRGIAGTPARKNSGPSAHLILLANWAAAPD